MITRCESLEARRLLSIPVGPEFRVNTNTTEEQTHASVAMADDGSFVVVWQSLLESGLSDGNLYDIFAQRFDGSGTPQGGEFRVNSYTTGIQLEPVVAMQPSGQFVVAWDDTAQDGSYSGVYARRFGATGAPLGADFKVSSFTPRPQGLPAIAIDSSGDFVVVWQSDAQDGSNYGVYAQRFDASGARTGDELRVNTYTNGQQYDPAVAMDGDGNFVVTWTSSNQVGIDNDIFAQRYDHDGVPAGSEFLVNTLTQGSQQRPAVSLAPDGQFTIAWLGNPENHVYARSYSEPGAPLANQFRVSSARASLVNRPSLAADVENHVVFLWVSSELVARMYDPIGQPLGAQFPINTYTTGLQEEPVLAMDAAGDFVVTWSSDGQDGSRLGIYGQRFINSPELLATSFNYQTAPMSLEYRFSEDVSASLNSTDLVLLNQTRNTTIPSASIAVTYDTATNTARFTFPGYPNGMLPDGNYLATIPAAAVQDVAGHSLTSDVSRSFFHLAGDANHDRKVNVVDLGILASNWQQSPRTFAQGDFNLDGMVNEIDLGLLAGNWQLALAPPPSLKGASRSPRNPANDLLDELN